MASGREILAEGLARMAGAYASLASCAAELDRLRGRFESIGPVDAARSCGKAVWISVLDMQERLVLGTMRELGRFVSEAPGAPKLVRVPNLGAGRMRDPPLIVVIMDGVRTSSAVARARDDLAAAREYLQSLLKLVDAARDDDPRGTRRQWRERLMRPYSALDAGVRAMDRFARVLDFDLPLIAAFGLLARPSSLEAFG